MRQILPLTHFRTAKFLQCLFIFAFLLLLAEQSSAQTIRYVKAGGTGNGSSWQNASGALQNMINASAAGDQVWVAAGEYQPGSGFFYMKEGVKIYGGFNGNEQHLTERNHRENLTILKGIGYRVIQNDRNGLTSQAVLDGFSITGGESARGAGVYNYFASPTLANLTIKGNKSSGYGGGISLLGSNSTLTNVTISGNEAGTGAGLELTQSSPKLTNVLISGNLSTGSGGGIYSNESSPTLINTTIAGNKATYDGGGIYQSGGTLTIHNTVIHGNSSGLYISYDPNLVISHSLIQGRTDTENGNISGSSNPLFRNAISPGLSTAGDYSLLSNSPAVDAGNDTYLPQGLLTDLAGNPRTAYAAVDMGAYENQETSCQVLPQSLTILPQSITISGAEALWLAPAEGVANGYQYGLSTSSALPPAVSTLTYTENTTATLTGLSPSTTYYLWVRGLCSNTNPGAWLVSAPFTTLPYNGPRYVKAGGTGEGISWESASGDLQAMINISNTGGEVLVAKGTYYPTQTQSGTTRTQAFLLNKAIKIKGGYDAATGLRDPAANPTVLSGNIGNPNSETDNSFTVLHITANAEVDGFTIRDGYASGPSTVIERTGAGVYNTASPIVRNCIFTANKAIGNGSNGIGAGWFNYDSGANPQLVNCLFYGNSASSNGGALTADTGHPVIINSTFYGNTTANTAKGTLNFLNNSLTLLNSIVYGNEGKGINLDGSGQFNIAHSLVQDATLPSGSQDLGGNLLARDPLFTDPANNNFVPIVGSPVLNAGSNEHLPTGLTTDLAGNERLLNGTVDMGAYEWQNEIPLPVTLIHFTAKLKGNQTKLTWQTASEQNSKEFIVYRATNTHHFTEIARIPAAGFSYIRQEYTFWDEAPALGTNYYRLGQEDIDGNQEQFNVRAVYLSKDEDRLTLFPNPTSEKDKVKARFKAGKYSRAELLNLHGSVLQSIPINMNTASLELEIGHYATGTYILRLYSEEGAITGKLLKW